MSVAELKSVLDTLEDASCCGGTFELDERLALALPDGDLNAVGEKNFVY